MEIKTELNKPQHHVRFVTAASLFDGHDATINIVRRLLQDQGAEVIHLGHNRAVHEIVDAAVQEDVQAVALTCYQGGHMEFFRYTKALLQERGAGHIHIFGGGGGVIVPEEIRALEAEGIDKIFSPDDGRRMGLEGMMAHMIRTADHPTPAPPPDRPLSHRDPAHLARVITLAELNKDIQPFLQGHPPLQPCPVVGITGTGGAGKSSLTDNIVRRFLEETQGAVAILAVDPSRRRTGGALLADRIRVNAANAQDPRGNTRVFLRSMATRASHTTTSQALKQAIALMKAAGFDLVLVETAGIGQSDSEVVDLVDLALYVMTADYGAAIQLEKIDMLDYADMVVINKFDKRGSLDALRDVRKQLRRNAKAFDRPEEEMPAFGTVASQFGDKGTDWFYESLLSELRKRFGVDWAPPHPAGRALPEPSPLLPPQRQTYLAEIIRACREYRSWTEEQVQAARRVQALSLASREVGPQQALDRAIAKARADLDPRCAELIRSWPEIRLAYQGEELIVPIRGRELKNKLACRSLSGLRVSKVALPRFEDDGEILRYRLLENLPGHFPFTAGVFPFRRQGEDPTRMFAGEGTPERTNKRFHYLAQAQPAARLSTAFDSVTLYGDDPDPRPDIYGKVGNSGVAVATLDDAKRLYAGFDLCAPNTSVSMTINGPAPMLLAMFLNTAIDQQVERHLRETGRLEKAMATVDASFKRQGLPRPAYRGNQDAPTGDRAFGLAMLGVTGDQLLDPEAYSKIKAQVLQSVRGTVQADILKEDQAQNTCIFSIDFALRMMADVQDYFVRHKVRNYYSVSISGYHIAEAGANPITQLAFTLANGFTYVESYLARGMHIDDFAHNLSFFFSNGLDPEYTVIGRVARRIWAVAMSKLYGGNERSQKLKYHIQTSGRSLHAKEIDLNDIRTTLQALYAHFDACNSLHTNSYDEAITTPTEESVRRALAIQLIISRELGLARNENPWQGSYIVEELTDLVEEAVLAEFERLNARGGVLGAMESQYQRNEIQRESLIYEHLKHSGELPIIGVNTFLRPPHLVDRESQPVELIRSTDEEKEQHLENLRLFHRQHAERMPGALAALKEVARAGGNTFGQMMETVKACSLGQISQALYRVGGQYRRSM